MARKSRKPSGVTADGGQKPAGAREERRYRAALYARLSVEDDRKRENGSIENQIALLEAYAERHPDLTVSGVYADRGESGTNFERPAFERMLSDLRAGKADCVVVKDLSRFGRNHIETGNYIERVFPFLGVRFIAVNDGYDSGAPDGNGAPLSLPLRNLVNELYAKDISVKVTSQLAVKRRLGEFLGTFAPYGYLKSPDDRHRLVIDPETAPVVRDIFRWKLEGLGETEIARRLTASGTPPPGVYRYGKQIVTHEKFRAAAVWQKSAVQRILANPVYLGLTAQGKQRASYFVGKRRRALPPEVWTVVRDTHEAVIDKEAFSQAQKRPAGRMGQGGTPHAG